jgi:hypothetical protein
MKFRHLACAFSGVLIAWACTPISPSVHKSTLRPGPSVQILPKQEDASEPAAIIEARWIHSEDELNRALDRHSSAMVVRLSSELLEDLKSDGVASIELPKGADQKPLERARVFLRVDMESEDLERALADEAWSFSWNPARPNALEIRSFYGKKSGALLALPEALISVHVVLQHDSSR